MIENARATWLGRYEPIGTLGEGGYGIVYEAIDRTTGDHVALKELSHVSNATVTRFKQEFRTVQEVHHPNLVRLDHLFEETGKWVIAMELVPGEDLLSHLYTEDNDLGFDEPTLRAAFLQLAEGLAALHAAGLLHRDLKPSNVRVTPEGRVVVLDFGLTTALSEARQSAASETLGTIGYMAPEQMLGQILSPAVDWYAFGVCLYEALTGFRPFDGESAHELLAAKLQEQPPPAASQAGGLPPELDALCLGLLTVVPEQRPGIDEIRRVLSVAAPAVLGPQPLAANANAGSFEGRESELRVLEAAFERSLAGAHQVVLIEGESGIGKSALIEHFLRGPLSNQAHVLRSRCYENELLAYKAFDGALTELAHILSELDSALCAALLPPRAALVCRLFPALCAVEALASQPLHGVAAAPSAQRLEAFGVIRRLLSRLSELRPIVIAIEDLQWADAESFRLLQALLSGPQPVRCLILATIRPASELEPEAAENIAMLRGLGGVTDLALSGLPRPNALKLAHRLLPAALPESWIESVVRESAGHPLFLTVLARFIEIHTPKQASELTLDAAIAAQLGALSPQARALLETVAVGGAPLPAPVCRRASGVATSTLGPLVAELCAQRLLRRRRAGEIACFHDRIRHVVVKRLSADRAKALHADLAHALAAQPNADPAVLARHHDAAGELALAHRFYRSAAEHATATLAFARAAVLYARALSAAERLEYSAAERVALRSARAHALACSARSAEAAHEYLEAAPLAKGEDRTRLRILAAQHLLQSARVEEGLAAARELLAELDVPLPRSTTSAFAHLLWDRAALRLSGLEMKPNPEPLDTKARMQLAALWGLSMPVGYVQPVSSMTINTRHLKLARAYGESTHMAQALGEEAFARAIARSDDPSALALLVKARELTRSEDNPAIEVQLAFREATVGTLYWDLPQARQKLEHAERLGTERCPDQPWLLTNVRTALGSVLANLGEFSALADCTSAWIAEARDRNDRFAVAAIEGLGSGTLRHLMVDDPDRAEATLAAALEPWPLDPFSFTRLGEVVAALSNALYRGGDHALRWLEREQPRLDRALLLKLGAIRVPLVTFQANAYLAAVGGKQGRDARALLRRAEGCARELRGQRSLLARVARLGIEAQLAALSGDRRLASGRVSELGDLSVSRENPLLLHFIECFQGKLEGGDGGRERQRTGLSYFADQGWKDPGRAVAMLWPALAHL